MNYLISASLYHGHSVSFFHQLKLNSPEKFKHFVEIGDGDIKKGYTIYKETISLCSREVVDFIYSLNDDEVNSFLKALKKIFTKRAEKAIFKRIDQISFKEYLILVEVNKKKEDIAREIRE